MDCSIRSEIQSLRRANPFRPFALTMENGERIMIEHPENLAFEPDSAEGVGGWEDFYVISGELHMFSTFNAITSIAIVDSAEV